jgi:hypothetical protein
LRERIELIFVRRTISDKPPHSPTDTYSFAWIGLRDLHPQSPHQFTWTDNTSFDYTNWKTDYPNEDISYDCGFMYLDRSEDDPSYPDDVIGKWGNYPCDNVRSTVCVCQKSQ